MSQKATIEQLILVESKFKEYAEYQEFHELKQSLKDFVQIESHKRVRAPLTNSWRISSSLWQRLVKIWSQLRQSKRTSEIWPMTLNRGWSRECGRMNSRGWRLRSRIGSARLWQSTPCLSPKWIKVTFHIQRRVHDFVVHKTLQEVEENHKKSVTQIEFKKETNQLWKNFEKYCAYKHMDELKGEVFPKIKR